VCEPWLRVPHVEETIMSFKPCKDHDALPLRYSIVCEAIGCVTVDRGSSPIDVDFDRARTNKFDAALSLRTVATLIALHSGCETTKDLMTRRIVSTVC
jgi:hypothetical protein